MTRFRTPLLWVQAVLVLAVSVLDAAPVQTEPSERRVAFVAADHELLADVIEQSGVATAAPQPGITAYVAYAASRLTKAVVDWLSPLGSYAGRVGEAFVWVAAILVAIAAALLLWALARYAVRRLRGSADESESPWAGVVPEPEHLRRERDRDEWRRELEERLARSDVSGALEATWWWLARSVLGATVRSSWTSGELLARARRPTLRQPLRTLERLMYGGVPPSVDEVRAVARQLEETLA